MSESGSDGRNVGRSVRSLSGHAPVAGRGTYAGDFSFPGQLYAHFVRSPHAAARIRKVEMSGAEKVASVVRAMDGQEAAALIDPIPHYIDDGKT